MNSLGWRARSYIVLTLVASLVFNALDVDGRHAIQHGMSLTPYHLWSLWIPFAALLLVACVAQKFKVEAVGNTAYYTTPAIFFAGTLLLPVPLVTVIIIFAHITEYFWRRIPWYIQLFNVCSWIMSAAITRMVYGLLTHGNINSQVWTLNSTNWFTLLAAISLAAIIYTGVNHILVGLVVSMARQRTLRESQVFDTQTLMMDGVLVCLGATTAILWMVNPLLMVLSVAPLFLVRQSLHVPALQQEARLDSKTGLYNMRHFNEMLKQEIERATRENRSFTLIMADLDLLRNINNTYGHLAGDIVLIGISDIIREHKREYDVAARFGGEEFAILLPNTRIHRGATIAERLRKAVEVARFQVETSLKPIGATISMGLAEFPEHGRDAKTLIHNADLAVYKAKLEGRNRVRLNTASAPILEMPTEYPDAPEGGTTTAAAPGSMPPVSPPEPTADPIAIAAPDEADDDGTAAHPAVVLPDGETTSRPAAATPMVTSPPAAADTFLTRHSQGFLISYVVLVVLAGLALQQAFLNPHMAPGDMGGVLMLTLLTGLAEAFPMDLYGPASLSLGFVLTFMVVLLYGMPGMSLCMWTPSLVKGLMHKQAPRKVAFNAATLYISAAPTAMIFYLMRQWLGAGASLTFDNMPALIIPAVIGAVIYFVINTLLVSEAIALDTGRPMFALWKENFAWLAPHNAVMGLLSLLSAVAFNTLHNIWGLAAFAAPLLMMRYTVKQYLDRTVENVAELRRLNTELKDANGRIGNTNMQLLRTLGRTIDARDPFVLGHSFKVSEYARAIAKEMGLSPEEQELVRQGGLLHDIGKIGITDEVLHKPGKLTAEEFDYIKTHTSLGASLLDDAPQLQAISLVIRHHHERFDGRGYPDGLASNEIPIAARIVGVSDAVEAMASDRPYKRAMPPEEIVAELERNTGTNFDPAVVGAFRRLAFRDGFITNSGREVLEKQQDMASKFGFTDLMRQIAEQSEGQQSPEKAIVNSHI